MIRCKPNPSLLFITYGWRQAIAIAIYDDTEYGAGFIPNLNDAFLEAGSSLQHRTVLPTSASNELIDEELYKLMTTQTHVFIVHMSSPTILAYFYKFNNSV
ncbi:hypothetical protein AMTR_s00064p00144430 [Amborella trichopoda]|uniref:Receptor ligand binding region domain-containing protein n=1 Tax=Amborella trichopoda TaxID=13333 RepID=U5DED5_AMBTC|nr:hypothetical protein AMTR_s00064p00144430 [Amborella trichopoda]